MHHTLLIMLTLAATSSGLRLPQRHLEPRDTMLNTGPGCASYLDPDVALMDQNSVTQWYSMGSPALSQSGLTNCLNEYGCGNFSNSWNGNVCGGRGWFKGPPSSKTSSDECYHVLAPWILLNGIRSGSTYYKAMLGRKGCYMGYNDPDPDPSSQ